MALSILIGVLIFTLCIGLPLPFCMGSAALIALFFLDLPIPLTIVPQRFISGIDSFSFMAIPFFLLVGIFCLWGRPGRYVGVDFRRLVP